MSIFQSETKVTSVEHIPSAGILSNGADIDEELEAPRQRPAFVREIPDSVWEIGGERLKQFVLNELSSAETERSSFVKKLTRWKHMYDAPIPENPKNFPIANASNLTIPVIKEAVNTIAAEIIQSTITNERQWIFEDLADEWLPYVEPLEKFFDVAAQKELKMDEVCPIAIGEKVKLGTTIYSVDYEIDERGLYLYSADGQKVFKKRVVRKDGPALDRVPLEDFYIRFYEQDPDKANWCGRKIRLNESELRRRVKQGRFDAEVVDRIIAGTGDEPEETTRDAEKREETKPSDRATFEVMVLYVSFDIDDDGEPEELYLHWSPEAQDFLSKKFNPFWHGLRPFVVDRFMPIEDRFYGQGLAEMLEQLQVAISLKTNQRNDNAMMANLKMLITRQTVQGLKPGDPLYTGKIIRTNDIWNDIREFQMAEIYPSTVNEEMILRSHVDRISGLNDGSRGAGMPVSRTTATAQLALLQESKKRIDFSIRLTRKSFEKIAFLTTNLYFQHGLNGKALAWLGDKGRPLESLFDLPRRVLEIGFAIRAHSPTSVRNQQVRRENAIALFNLMVQLYERLLPLVGQVVPESATEIVSALVASAHRFMQEVLSGFEVSRPEEVLEGLATLKRILPNAEDLGGLDSFERAEATAQSFANLTRLEDLLREVEGVARGSDGLRPTGEEPRRLSLPEGLSGGIPGTQPTGRSPTGDGGGIRSFLGGSPFA